MRVILILLWSTLALFLEPNHLAHLQAVVIFTLVPFCDFLTRDTYLLADSLEGIAGTDFYKVIVVVTADRMERSRRSNRLVYFGTFHHELVIASCVVVLIEFVKLYDVNKPLGIMRIGSIACRFQSPRPTTVVISVEVEEPTVASSATKELAVVFVALLGIVVGTEALAESVVVMVDGTSAPPVALYTEVVVALSGKLAIAGGTLQKSLGKSDAGWHTILKHFLDGKVFILIDIVLVSRIPTHPRTCYRRQQEQKQEDESQNSSHWKISHIQICCKNTSNDSKNKIIFPLLYKLVRRETLVKLFFGIVFVLSYFSTIFANMKVIISLGSNTNQEENIQRAREILSHLIPDATFTEPEWTEPVPEKDRPAGKDKYLNCLVEGHVHLSEKSVIAKLKQLEITMGDNHESHITGHVNIDLDLIQYGDHKVRDIIWK